MYTLSRTSEQCRKCKHVMDCNSKRLEACGLAELPKQNIGMSSIEFNTINNAVSDEIINPTIEYINKKITETFMITSCYFGGGK